MSVLDTIILILVKHMNYMYLYINRAPRQILCALEYCGCPYSSAKEFAHIHKCTNELALIASSEQLFRAETWLYTALAWFSDSLATCIALFGTINLGSPQETF